MAEAGGGSVATWSDRLLDAIVLFLATWTVVYHVCLVLRLSTTWAVALEVVALVGAAALLGRRSAAWWPWSDPRASDPAVGSPSGDDLTGPWTPHWLAPTAVVAACVAAVATALSLPWVLVWVPWLAAAAAGTIWALGRTRPPTPDSPDDPATAGSRWTTAVVLTWAAGLAVWSLWTLRPNPDDLFYVNLSQWVAGHGEFPVRDTLFSNLTYPMANWPPVASYDGLVGVIARLVHAHAASVEYVGVPPVMIVLSVLALWRLLRAWRVPHIAWALSAAIVFLIMDGTSSYASPGNLWVTRLWQGKIILLCVLVPVLLVQALRYVERPGRARALPLALGGIAAVGLSTTGMFLVPVLALGAMAPLVRRSWRGALTGFVALSAYPVGAALVTVALGGRSADDFGDRRLYRFDAAWIGHEIFLTGLLALVGVLVVLLGALLVPHPAARVTTGVLALCTGLVLVPGATRAAYDLAGLGPTLWRLSWALSIGALVGVAVVRAGTWLAAGTRDLPLGRWATPLAGVVALALVAVFGAPVWSQDTSTTIRAPFHWQRSHSSRSVVAQILAATRPGDVVLAPDALSITTAVTTTAVKTVAPRDYYMDYLRHDPRFHYPERLALVHYVNHVGPRDIPGIAHDLRVVGVEVACTRREDRHRYAVLRAAGYHPLLTSTYYRCLKRS